METPDTPPRSRWSFRILFAGEQRVGIIAFPPEKRGVCRVILNEKATYVGPDYRRWREQWPVIQELARPSYVGMERLSRTIANQSLFDYSGRQWVEVGTYGTDALKSLLWTHVIRPTMMKDGKR